MKDGAVTTHERKIDGSGAPLEGIALRAIRTEAEKQIGAIPKSKTVLYPMSGFDSGTPLHLFPDATTIIGIDNHPFLPVGQAPKAVEYSRIGTHNFAYYGDVDRLGHVGPAVIGGLASAVPNFRLRSVTVIEDEGGSVEVVRGFAAKGRDPGTNATRAAGHAVVEFDGGPGTPVRRYIHINGSLIAGRTKNTWWWKAIDQLGPNAVLLKGSEAVLQKDEMGAELRPQVLGWLKQSKGVLIEDKDIYSGRAGLSKLDGRRNASGRIVSHPSHEGARSAQLETRGWSFGYSRGPQGEVFVTVFDQ